MRGKLAKKIRRVARAVTAGEPRVDYYELDTGAHHVIGYQDTPHGTPRLPITARSATRELNSRCTKGVEQKTKKTRYAARRAGVLVDPRGAFGDTQ